MNCKMFYKSKGTNVPKSFKKMFEAGYFGNAAFDPATRVYDIHEDTPLPYTYEKKTEGVDNLSLELLEAARLTRSVFPRMFPRIQAQTVLNYIELFVRNGHLRRVNTASGVQYLELSPKGRTFFEELKQMPNKQRVERISILLNAFAEPAGKLIGEAVATALSSTKAQP